MSPDPLKPEQRQVSSSDMPPQPYAAILRDLPLDYELPRFKLHSGPVVCSGNNVEPIL